MKLNLARVVSAVVVAGAMGGSAGCSVPFDMDKWKKSVATEMEGKTGLAIASVECPTTNGTLKSGESFECVATPKDGGKITIKVDVKDSFGHVQWDATKLEGVLDLRILEAAIVEDLKKTEEINAVVSCGGKFRVAKPPVTFDCNAKYGDESKTVVVTMGADGKVQFEMVMK